MCSSSSSIILDTNELPPFTIQNSTVAPQPQFLVSTTKSTIPTNAWWSNLMLGDGSGYIPQTPFSLKAIPDTGLQICYPNRVIGPSYIFQNFNADWTISSIEPLSSKLISRYSDLSVTVDYGRFTVPIVRGTPYITAIYSGSTPTLSTIHAILSTDQVSPTKIKMVLNNNSTWIVYSSVPIQWQVVGNVIQAPISISGVIRISTVISTDQEPILDRYSSTFPLNGHLSLNVYGTEGGSFSFDFDTQRLVDGDNSTDPGILFLLLPNHQKMNITGGQIIPSFTSYRNIRGLLQGIAINPSDNTLSLSPKIPFNVGWTSNIPLSSYKDITAALQKDMDQLPASIPPDSYSAGKVLALFARLILIADHVGELRIRNTLIDRLILLMNIWTQSIGPDKWVYDDHFGIIITSNGAVDRGADYGVGVFNDVGIFHQGYHLYAAAVLAKFNSVWRLANTKYVSALAKNYACPNKNNTYFPFLRNHDAYELISYASGLVGYSDGSNKESTSESCNGFYAIALLGSAYKDTRCEAIGRLLTANEIITAQTYWHMNNPNDSLVMYEPPLANQYVLGNLFSNKVDGATWFGNNPSYAIGIQVIPVTPLTKVLFSDTPWVQAATSYLTSIASSNDTSPEWKAFVLSIIGITPDQVKALTSFDNGNTLTNMLYFAYSH